MSKRTLWIALAAVFFSSPVFSQTADTARVEEPFEKIPLTFYKKKTKEFYDGEFITVMYFPEFPVYGPLDLRTDRQRRQYNRLVYNVKKTLPIAKRINAMIKETYEVLQMLPDEESKSRHISAVEKSIKKQFEPEMRKLTYSQGKLLIKLVDRECNQSSYEIVKAFFGPGKAMFYQLFAFTFRASLKKEYRPDTDDRLVERIARQVELGLL